MKLALIGNGAIARHVAARVAEVGAEISAVILRSESLAAYDGPAGAVDRVAKLPRDVTHVVDCAGHAGLRAHGPSVLESGRDLITVSLGALADTGFHETLDQAALQGRARLWLASGAVGGLDALRAARMGDLRSVSYTGRKPPQGWKGSAAEGVLDLDALHSGARTHFTGTAGQAALNYPRNANVAAAVALAGLGFERTRVTLIADADLAENVHEIEAEGDFGRFSFRLAGHALPDTPRSSALAAMSVLSRIAEATARIAF